MKIVLLVTGGRTGSDLFQSLLDTHSQILQFPGTFYYYLFYNNIKSFINDYTKIANYFVNTYPSYFNSKLNLRERHNQLGENKDEFYEVDQKIFIEKFIEISKKIKLTKKKILINLHKSYYLASNIPLKDIRMLFLHIHHRENLEFYEDIADDLLYTIRDPLVCFQSGITNWKKYNKNNKTVFNSNNLYYQFDRIINGLLEVNSYKFKIKVIKLEDIHNNNLHLLSAFCKYFYLTFEPCLTQSTYFGKKWWGDQLSIKYLNGINNNFKNVLDQNFYYKNDIIYIENILSKFMLKYSYKKTLGNYKNPKKFLPLKCESILGLEYLKKFQFLQFLNLLRNFFKRITKNNKIKNQIYPDNII